MKTSRGFTLIEVLIAMMIIAIAFTAILKAIGDDTQRVAYLESRSEASWVAMNLINSVNTGLLSPSTSGDLLTGHVKAFGRNWQWTLSLKATDNKQIFVINTRVTWQQQTLATLIGTYSADPVRLTDDPI